MTPTPTRTINIRSPRPFRVGAGRCCRAPSGRSPCGRKLMLISPPGVAACADICCFLFFSRLACGKGPLLSMPFTNVWYSYHREASQNGFGRSSPCKLRSSKSPQLQFMPVCHPTVHDSRNHTPHVEESSLFDTYPHNANRIAWGVKFRRKGSPVTWCTPLKPFVCPEPHFACCSLGTNQKRCPFPPWPLQQPDSGKDVNMPILVPEAQR